MGLVIYDGECIFCSKYIRLLIKMDKKDVLKFSTFDGEIYKRLIKEGLLDPNIDSVIYVRDSKIYYKSTAIIEMIKDIQKLGFLLQFLYIIPSCVRDKFYEVIAKRRYNLVNRECPIMPSEYKKKFIK
jgi:predicted DCC family thiol-disulfide oxidoreductase YuxK